MEDSKLNKIDSSEDSVYGELDLTSQLRDKIRLQAQRLRSLEQYRALCEQRIQEIIPDHPIPITKEHLGQESPQNKELQLAKEKIARLEKNLSQQTIETNEDVKEDYLNDYDLLLEKYNDLLADKNDLEESLRAEMLNSEEQRTYIELLRQNIESKNNDFDGISFDRRMLPNINNTKNKTDENKREQNRFRHNVIEYESQIKRLTILLKNKELENENLINERHNLDSHLQQASEALQIAEEEVAKLEGEKISLLEYVEQHTVKEREMERELNDLSRYFEEMKKDFHETLSDLEAHKSIQNKYEVDNEVLKEELFKSNQNFSEQQAIINDLRETIQEKENIIKELKQDKTNAEIKIEKLQANIASLTESLKETQAASTVLQEQYDIISKGEFQKNENLTKIKHEYNLATQENNDLKEKLTELTNEIEAETKIRIELERFRELDIRQIQDFKIKILELQTKNTVLENTKKSKSDYHQLKEDDASKIAKLEQELNYLRETFREAQHRENFQVETLSNLKSHNSNLSKELEEIYQENEKLRVDLTKKTQDFEMYLSKFNHLNEYCESLENDKAEIDEYLSVENNSNRILKDQVLDYKTKIEDLARSLSELTKNSEKNERILQEKDLELMNYKKQLKLIEKDVEDEKQVKLRYLAEMKTLLDKIQSRDSELDKSNNEITNCCKIISAFCGKCTITYHDYRSCLSIGYKEFLDS